MQSTGFALGNSHSSFGRLPIKGALAFAFAALGERESRKVGNNTYLRRVADGAAVKLHSTDIVTITRAGIRLDSGGFRTHTTRDRINAYLPIGHSLYTSKGIWYLSIRGTDAPPAIPFADGMTIKPSGKVTGAGDVKADEKSRKAIHKFAADFAAACVAGKVPAPSGGDCWLCSMRTADGSAAFGEDRDHFLGHMKERYYVPSMFVNAAREAGAGYLLNFIFPALWGQLPDGMTRETAIGRERGCGKEIAKVLRKFLGKRFGLALR